MTAGVGWGCGWGWGCGRGRGCCGLGRGAGCGSSRVGGGTTQPGRPPGGPPVTSLPLAKVPSTRPYHVPEDASDEVTGGPSMPQTIESGVPGGSVSSGASVRSGRGKIRPRPRVVGGGAASSGGVSMNPPPCAVAIGSSSRSE